MLKNITLKATTRNETPGKVKSMRKSGFLPAVIYGQGKEAQSIKINTNDFVKVYEIAGESSLINLKIDEAAEIKAIIKSTQKHPLKNSFIHADIYKVNMSEKLEIEIPLNFIGEAKAEKELGGMLMKNHDSILGSCLPADLVEHIDVDLSKLKTFSDSIKVEDLEVPKEIEILTDKNESVVHVVPPKVVVENEEVPEVVENKEEDKGSEKVASEPKEEKKKK